MTLAETQAGVAGQLVAGFLANAATSNQPQVSSALITSLNTAASAICTAAGVTASPAAPVAVVSTNGATYTEASVEVTVTCSGATSVATNLIPAGATLKGLATRVLTTITGATSFKIGDGTTANLYADTVGITAGVTTGSADYVTPLTPLAPASRSITLTATGSNFTGGTVRVVAFYATAVGPTA